MSAHRFDVLGDDSFIAAAQQNVCGDTAGLSGTSIVSQTPVMNDTPACSQIH